jgi:hypothetical protein
MAVGTCRPVDAGAQMAMVLGLGGLFWKHET